MPVIKPQYLLGTLIAAAAAIFASPVFAVTTIPVPFSMQAPYSQWGVQPWEDACEETTIMMVDHFYRGSYGPQIERDVAMKELAHIVWLENWYFGFNKDTNAEQIVTTINNFFPWEAYVVDHPSVEDIVEQIDMRRPVIIPFYGKAVKNPYFKNGGPDYHTAVVKGYDNEKRAFIVQEPGNGRGLDYRYPYDTLMNAMHDFLPDNRTRFGKKVAIFTKPSVQATALLDADEDGLTKAEELQYKTALWSKDTDGDGYSDKTEILHGYSPTLAENKLQDGTLIKAPGSPRVYLMKAKKRHHIANEQVFYAHGYRWSDIVEVSDVFMKSIFIGPTIKF